MTSRIGYEDEKVARLTKEAIASGFTHFKARLFSHTNNRGISSSPLLPQMKVGADFNSDLRRAKLIRSIIDDPASFPPNYQPLSAERLEGKNAGPTGCVLMMDANQVRQFSVFLADTHENPLKYLFRSGM